MHRTACVLAARRSVGRSAVIYLLVLSLLVYGYSSTVLRMLGPMHRHSAPGEVVTSVLADTAFVKGVAEVAAMVRQWHQRAQGQRWLFTHDAQQRQRDSVAEWEFALRQLEASEDDHQRTDQHEDDHAHGVAHTHTHDHGVFERHFHDPSDDSVVALDEHGANQAHIDGLSSAAAVGSATLPFGVSTGLTIPQSPGRRASWPPPAQAAWRNAILKSAERPPSV